MFKRFSFAWASIAALLCGALLSGGCGWWGGNNWAIWTGILNEELFG